MNPQEVLVAVLLAVALLLLAGSAAGMFAASEVFERLHYVGPSVVAAWAVAGAVLVHTGWSADALKAGLVAGLLTLWSPVLSHATARAARVRQYGHWAPMPGERDGR